jgi:hypothetical protein
MSFNADFMLAKGREKEKALESAKVQKEHRRAQVRKAQLLVYSKSSGRKLTEASEHRQRKKNYVKHLEQDVIELRQKISTAETEATGVRDENAAIRSVLSGFDIPLPPIVQPTAQRPPIDTQLSDLEFNNFQSPTKSAMGYQSAEDTNWSPSGSSSATVSVDFNDLIDAHCLVLSPTRAFIQDTPNPSNISSPPKNTLTTNRSEVARNLHERDGSQPAQNASYGSITPTTDPAIDFTAINFILA